MIRVKNIKLKLDENESTLITKVAKLLRIKENKINSFEITKKALDSRKKNNLTYVYSIDINIENEFLYTSHKDVSLVDESEYFIKPIISKKDRPIVIGSGPAGLFATLILAQAGLNPILIEQGKDVDSRKKDIDLFWKTGELNVDSNVQFGAGGAGTFSDGKLTTSTKDSRRKKLMDELIKAGAPEEISFLSKAHIGTDILINVVRNLCSEIIRLGGEIRYNTKFIDFQHKNNILTSIDVLYNNNKETLNTQHLVIAIGHSARKTFEVLYQNKINMSAKSFSVGVRIEHKQSDINTCQYGTHASMLDAASYKLSTHLENGRGVYTFCMCPGGLVVAASSEQNRVVTNGMSYYARSEENSNSAVLVSITPKDFDGDVNPLNGIEFQRRLEEKAFELGGKNYFAPVQTVEDYLNNRTSLNLNRIIPSYKPGFTLSNLNDLFPDFINHSLHVALQDFSKKIAAFSQEDAVITGVESRSSSPVTIHRDEYFETNIRGIYPSGEGAGFAGGIVSAAIDGIKVAEKILDTF